MTKLHKKKANILGKKIPVLLLVGVLAFGLATAALLPYFGQITGSATVEQGLTIDEDKTYADSPITETYSDFTSLEAKTFVKKHSLNNNADVDAEVSLSGSCVFEDTEGFGKNSCSETTISYEIATVTDDEANWDSQEPVVEFDVDLTLDEIFESTGFEYEYTILDRGQSDGAAPVVAVMDLEDAGYVVLYPGYGTRTEETHTLQFSDTTAQATGGSNNVVDFAVYDSDWSKIDGSSSPYPAWDTLEGDLTTVDGNDGVDRIYIMTQGADTGQKDRVESMLINGTTYEFQGESLTVFKDSSIDFNIVTEFQKMTGPGEYTIETLVEPAE